MLELFENAMMDIVSMLLIILSIDIVYKKRYQVSGYLYVKEQLNMLSTYCVIFLIIFYLYYYLENKFHYDSEYMNGIFLVVFILLAGIVSKIIYKKYFANKLSHYQSSDEDRVVLTLAAFVAISIRLVAIGVIKIVIPISIVLGKFIWLDTESIENIINIVKTKHKRIIETSIIFVMGILILSIVTYILNVPRYMNPVIILIYGLIIIWRG